MHQSHADQYYQQGAPNQSNYHNHHSDASANQYVLPPTSNRYALFDYLSLLLLYYHQIDRLITLSYNKYWKRHVNNVAVIFTKIYRVQICLVSGLC